jgi:hypothetical protein
MRDPGTPRRNPLFGERPADEQPGEDSHPVAPDDPGTIEAAAAAADEGVPPRDAPGADEGAPPRDAPPAHDHSRLGSGGACPLCSLGLFASTMRDASPEAMDHLLGAAHEFLLAAKVVLDAADRAVELQRAQLLANRDAAREQRARRSEAAQHAGPMPPAKPSDEPSPPESSGRVRRIHLA